MKRYCKNDIQYIYSSLINKAQKEFLRGKIELALKYIKSAASWMYQFNLSYCDEKADNILREIAQQIGRECVKTPISGRCVLIDSWGWDNKGLTQQYINGLMKNDYEILYICTSKDYGRGCDIQKSLKNFGKASFYYVESKDNPIAAAKVIKDLIVDFSSDIVLLHILPYDTAALIACDSLENATVYNINLTDHAFWLGTTIIDYNIEFRPYGKTISIEKRNIKENKLLNLPFFPSRTITHSFEGLPDLPQNSVKVFTGGALYKMLGGDNIFFRLMDVILDRSPNVIILVAGFAPDKRFSRGKSTMKNGDRVLEIGIRSDIDTLFEKIDIYLGTYPTSGGLMTQYAAIHGKPIIAYYKDGDVENKVEEMTNHFQNSFKSFSNIDEFAKYAEKLINDEEFRFREGQILKNGLMTEVLFSNELRNLLLTHTNRITFNTDVIDYDSFFRRYLDLENNNGFMASQDLVTKLKWRAVTALKGYRLNMLEALITVAFKVLSNKFVN